MDILLAYETWLILGIVLALAEIVIPGGILLNLALASFIVATGVGFEWLETWVSALTTWFISASLLLFVVYFFTDKLLKFDQRIDNVYEEVDIYGQKVLVTETIGPGEHKGRVEFHGTSWTALSDGRTIKAGSTAKIICKENISLLVEPNDQPAV